MPLSVDVNEVAVVPNPAPDLAMKALPAPQTEEEVDLCTRGHLKLSLLFTLQMVNPFMSPVTVQMKVKVSPGQVGVAVNCPVTLPIQKEVNELEISAQQ